MPSECIQALSPGYSELHSPDSLYSKDSSDLLPEEIKLGSAKLMDLGINGINGGPLHNDQMQSEVPAHHTASLLDLMESFSDVPASTQMNNAHPAGMTLAQMMPSAAATMQIKQENMDAQTLLQQLESSLQNLNQENDLLVPNGAGSHRSPVASPDTTVFTTDNSLVYSVFEQENAVLPDAPHVDSTTQRSLIEQSEAMALESNISPGLKNSIDNSPFWALLRDNNEHIQDGEPKDGQPRKARKSSLESDAPSSTSPEPTNTNTVTSNGFDINGAVSSSQFVFTKFGSDVPGIISLGMQSVKTVTSDVTSCRPMLATETVAEPTSKRVSIPSRRLKVPSLNMAFPTKSSSYELKIVVQPEEQHRARYMTEGSRGSIKDRSQDGHPVIKLLGYNQPATVQVYIGSDTGRVKPHGFYQACRVCGKNSTPCTEKDVDGTTVIEIALDPKEDMTVSVDCVGILKLRNADVEQRIGLARSKKKKVPTATLR